MLTLARQLEPAPVSSSESVAFQAIHKSLMEVLPEAVVAPVYALSFPNCYTDVYGRP